MNAGMKILAYRPATRDYSPLFRYGMAVYVTLAAMLVRGWLNPFLLDRLPYFLCYVAVIASLWLGGIRAGILSFVLGAVASTYAFVPPRYSFGISNSTGVLDLVSFLVGGVALLTLAKGYLSSLENARTELVIRTRTEQLLASSEERLRLAQQVAQAGTWDWDMLNGTQFWSNEFYGLLGLSPSVSLTYETWLSQIDPEDRDGIAKAIRDAMQDDTESLQFEYRINRDGGDIRWIESRGRIFRTPAGMPVRLIGVSIDITARRRADAMMIQNEKLISAGRMAATIAHEINNPLESVMNLVYLAKTNCDGAPGTHALLESAEAELARVNHIAKQTLGFYRDNAAPRPVLVSSIVRTLSPLYAAKLESRKISLKIHTRNEELVYANEDELRQVFANLLSNSLDAVGAGGTIAVRISRSTRWNAAQDPGVRITVADTGSGITSRELPRIFDPFFTTKKSVGTGLGLWVSKNLVEKYRGSITVRSCTRSGRNGTVVSVFLPSMTSRTAENSRSAVA